MKATRRTQGQSILEYSVLLCVILSSLLIMQFFIKRSYQGRIHEEASEIGVQYSPGHTSSVITTNVESISTTYTGGVDAESSVAIPDGMTLTKSRTATTFRRDESVDAFGAER